MPQLTCGSMISESDGIFEYEVDTNKTPIKKVLFEIASMDGVSDVEFKKAPIEQVIAELYTSWK